MIGHQARRRDDPRARPHLDHAARPPWAGRDRGLDLRTGHACRRTSVRAEGRPRGRGVRLRAQGVLAVRYDVLQALDENADFVVDHLRGPPGQWAARGDADRVPDSIEAKIRATGRDISYERRSTCCTGSPTTGTSNIATWSSRTSTSAGCPRTGAADLSRVFGRHPGHAEHQPVRGQGRDARVIRGGRRDHVVLRGGEHSG